MKYLLDTNIVVRWLHGMLCVADSIDRVGLHNCYISELTKAELLYGEELAMSRGLNVDRNVLCTLFENVGIVPVSGAIEMFASEKVRLQMCGTPIEDFDLLIGCSAVCGGMIMVTDNVGHLGRVSGIRVEKWAVRV